MNHKKVRASKAWLGLAVLLPGLWNGCLPFSTTGSDPRPRISPMGVFPDTLYVGSLYQFWLEVEDAQGPIHFKGILSDTLLVEWGWANESPLASSGNRVDVLFIARPQLDTMKVYFSDKNGTDSLSHVFQFGYLNGYAPIASLEVQRFSKKYSAVYGTVHSCAYTVCARDNFEGTVVFTPLQKVEDGYFWEQKEEGILNGSAYSRTDTLKMRMNGNMVQIFGDGNWNNPIPWNFPYFIQDTITTNLPENATSSSLGELKVEIRVLRFLCAWKRPSDVQL